MPFAAQLDADCLHMRLQWQPLDECALTIDEYTCMMYGVVSPALDTFGFEYRPCAAVNGGARLASGALGRVWLLRNTAPCCII